MNFIAEELEQLESPDPWRNFGDFIQEYFKDNGHINFEEIPPEINLIIRLCKLTPQELSCITNNKRTTSGHILCSKCLTLYKTKAECKKLQDEYDKLEDELLDEII